MSLNKFFREGLEQTSRDLFQVRLGYDEQIFLNMGAFMRGNSSSQSFFKKISCQNETFLDNLFHYITTLEESPPKNNDDVLKKISEIVEDKLSGESYGYMKLIVKELKKRPHIRYKSPFSEIRSILKKRIAYQRFLKGDKSPKTVWKASKFITQKEVENDLSLNYDWDEFIRNPNFSSEFLTLHLERVIRCERLKFNCEYTLSKNGWVDDYGDPIDIDLVEIKYCIDEIILNQYDSEDVDSYPKYLSDYFDVIRKIERRKGSDFSFFKLFDFHRWGRKWTQIKALKWVRYRQFQKHLFKNCLAFIPLGKKKLPDDLILKILNSF